MRPLASLTVETTPKFAHRAEEDSPFDLDMNSPAFDRSPVVPRGKSPIGRPSSPLSARMLAPADRTDNALLLQLENMQKSRNRRETKRLNNSDAHKKLREDERLHNMVQRSEETRRRKTQMQLDKFEGGVQTGNNRTSTLQSMRTLSAQLRVGLLLFLKHLLIYVFGLM